MKSKGVHRLSIGVGLLVAMIVFVLLLVESPDPFAVPLLLVGIEAAAFIVGWAAIRVGAWIVAGFREDQKRL